MEAPPRARPGRSPSRDVLYGGLALILGLLPALSAIAMVPEFSTQDGPAHLYSARILNASLGPSSPFESTFTVAWQPLPNWSGHLLTMATVRVFSPGVAGRVIAGLTLVALAMAVVGLRWVVAGAEGLWVASILATLLGLNVTWLLGFTSFLLGAALVPPTLALWWGGREWFGPWRALGLASMLVLGYFCHPISLGLSVVGLAVLSLMTPGLNKARRGLWTLASLGPMIPMGLAYRAMTRSGGGLEPTWEQLANPWSLKSWVAQLGWVDPISLAAKTFRPFSDSSSALNGLVSPVLWTVLGVGLLAISTRRKDGERRGWLVLAALMLAGGVFGPDTLGVKHGHYLPQRVALLGLVALVPWLDLSSSRWITRTSGLLLAFALAIQSAFVWDYALTCRARVGPLLRAKAVIGSDQRLGTLLIDIRGRFRSNPLLHADCLIGASNDNVVWTNYETAHYYFPVKVRTGLDHPSALDFEKVALLDASKDFDARARLWESVLEHHGDSIDLILEWGANRILDAINGRKYTTIYQDGPVRVWSRVAPR